MKVSKAGYARSHRTRTRPNHGTPRGFENLESRLLLSTVTVAPILVAEGASHKTAIVTARLNAPSASNIFVAYSTQDGTAKSGVNYGKTNSLLVIPAGATSATFNIPILANNLHQGLSSFNLNLAVSAGHTLSSNKSTVYVLDNDPAPQVKVGDRLVIAGVSTQTTLIPVTLSGPSANPVSVNFATVNRTALAGVDYQATNGTVTFAPGELTKLIPVQVLSAKAGAQDKAFDVVLTGATGATLDPVSGLFQHARVAIRNGLTASNARPTATVSNATVQAGGVAQFQVNLSAATTRPVTFRYQTVEMTADSSDFTPVDGLVTIPAGSKTATISVQTHGAGGSGLADVNFALSLTAPTNVNLASPVAWGTISFAPPEISVSDPVVTEGNAGTSTMAFTVTLSGAAANTVTVDYQTSNGTATAGSDYVAANGTLTFAPGETSKTVNVTVNGDVTIETDETLTLTLSNATEATIADATGTGTIANNDFPSLSIDSPSVTEEAGNIVPETLTFTVTLSQASPEAVTVDYTTSNGTATAGSDYTLATGTLTFAPGETTKTIDVAVTATSVSLTTSETFNLTLSNADNATIGTATGVGTIALIDALADNLDEPNAGGVFVSRAVLLCRRFVCADGTHLPCQLTV